MMHQGTKSLILALLALMLTAARASADYAVTVIASDYGTITADHVSAEAGTMVTLTVTPQTGYRLKSRSLVVEMIADPADADTPLLTRGSVPAVGGYANVTQVSETVYTFRMPATAVEVRGVFHKAMVIDAEAVESNNQTVRINHVRMEVQTPDEESSGGAMVIAIIMPESADGTPATIFIPATVTDSQGNAYPVTEIGSDMCFGLTNITDIILPDTDEPIHIDENAFRIDNLPGDDPNHHVVIVHTPLTMLDDYALMPGLEDNFYHQNVRSTAVAPNYYWTFSCGVDIILPEGLTPYYCRAAQGGHVEFMEIGGRVVAANNGVLLACSDNSATDYELTAKPNAVKTEDTTPSVHDAKTYPKNLLEPVIKAAHYDSGEYYILYGNEFHPILSEGDEVKVPACKAVLHITRQMQ